MNKTIIDAVNELKGDLDNAPKNCGYLKFSLITGGWFLSYASISNHSYEDVCTRKQFNDLVSQMETNFGRCSDIAVSHWKKCTKVLLTKSTKELEVMDIDWNKAPEGATHYVALGGDVVYYKIKDDDIKAFHNTWVTDNSEKEWLVDNVFHISNKPQPPLTYTQAMADNGELPSVGMEFMGKGYAYKSDTKEWFKLEALGVYNNKVIAESCNEANQVQLYSVFKPLTPPKTDKEKAIEKFMSGVYIHRDKHIIDAIVNSAYDAFSVQPLTVKE